MTDPKDDDRSWAAAVIGVAVLLVLALLVVWSGHHGNAPPPGPIVAPETTRMPVAAAPEQPQSSPEVTPPGAVDPEAVPQPAPSEPPQTPSYDKPLATPEAVVPLPDGAVPRPDGAVAPQPRPAVSRPADLRKHAGRHPAARRRGSVAVGCKPYLSISCPPDRVMPLKDCEW